MSRKLKETYHRFGELVVRKKAASPEVIDEILAVQRAEIERGRTPRRIGELLIERKILDRLTIREILHEQKLTRGEKRNFKVTLHDADGVALLGLEGRLDRLRISSLTRILEQMMNRGFARVAVDATKLAYVDSQGVAAFIPYIDESRARGGDVKFIGLNAAGRVVLDRLGLHRFMQSFVSKKDALDAFHLPIDEYMSRGALGEYVSTSTSRQVHLSYCALAQRLSETDRVYYESKWHARKDGKLLCKKCRP